MAGPGENIEIEISAKADGLIDALNRVAQNLESLQDGVAGLAGKFEATGKAAQDGMDKTGKAADGAGKSVSKLEKDMDGFIKKLEKMKTPQQRSHEALEAVADNAGRADSALSGMASVLDQINPEMAKNARLAADVAGMTEQMILAWTQAPAVVGAVVVALAAWEAATYSARKEAEAFMGANKKASGREDTRQEIMKKQADLRDQMTLSLKIYRGELTENDATLEKNIKTINARADAEIKLAKQRKMSIIHGSKSYEVFTRAREMYQQQVVAIDSLRESDIALAMAASQTTESIDYQSEAFQAQSASLSGNIESLSAFVRWNEKASISGGKLTDVDNLLTLSMVEMGGEMVNITDGVRLSEEAIRKLSEGFIANNQAASTTTEETAGVRRTIDHLNEVLDLQDDRWKSVEKSVEGARHGYGAINKVTGEVIGLAEMLNKIIAAHAEKIRAAKAEEAELAAKRKAWYQQYKADLEMLEGLRFSAEQTLRSELDAHAELFHKDMEMLDELADKYKRNNTMMTAIDETRQALLKEFAFERKEIKKSEAEEAFDLARAIQDQFINLENISQGKTFETAEYKIRLLEDVRDEQLFQLGRMEEDLKNSGANELDISRKVRAEELDVWNEFLQKKEELNKEFGLREEEQEEERIADRRKRHDDALTAGLELAQSMSTITQLMEEEMADASIEERRRLFTAQKVAATSETLINGAVAVTRAMRDLGPIAGPIAGFAIAASTAAQVSFIASENPAFDIGGMVRGGSLAKSPDQVSARLLPGEAVLNRGATSKIGEEGVNALNRGESLGSMVVVPAYRHFDRFIQDEYRKGGAFRKIVTKERDFPVGQRRY